MDGEDLAQASTGLPERRLNGANVPVFSWISRNFSHPKLSCAAREISCSLPALDVGVGYATSIVIGQVESGWIRS